MPGRPHPCNKRHHERRRRHPWGQHPAASALRDGGAAWAGGHARPARPGLGGRLCRDTERRLRDTPKAPPLSGFFVAPEAGAEPGGAPQQPPTAALPAGGFARGQDGRQHPGPPARGVPALSGGAGLAGRPAQGAPHAAPRARLRDAPGSARRGVRADTYVKGHPDTPFLVFTFFLFLFFFSYFFPSSCRTAGTTSNALASTENTAPSYADPSSNPTGGSARCRSPAAPRVLPPRGSAPPPPRLRGEAGAAAWC